MFGPLAGHICKLSAVIPCRQTEVRMLTSSRSSRPSRRLSRLLLAAARDSNDFGTRIDAVFVKLRDGLEWIALRERDDADSIPIIADPQFTSLCFFRSEGARVCHASMELLTITQAKWRVRRSVLISPISTWCELGRRLTRGRVFSMGHRLQATTTE